MTLSFFAPLDNLVAKNHPYRQFLKLLDFDQLTLSLKSFENTEVGRHGYGISKGFRMLLLQYVEDLSDRELERYLQENLAGKLFCGLSLQEVMSKSSKIPEFRANKFP